MTDIQKKCLEKLKEQTKGKLGTVNMCGRQIWDLARANADFAEIICADLDNKEMTVEMCEKQIKAAADRKHKEGKGNCAAVSPAEAENIIRKFYGLPLTEERDPWDDEPQRESKEETERDKGKADIIRLEDFL